MAFIGDLQFLRTCSLGPYSLVVVGKKGKQSATYRKLKLAYFRSSIAIFSPLPPNGEPVQRLKYLQKSAW